MSMPCTLGKLCIQLFAVVLLSACDPTAAPTRGPQSAPVEQVAFGRFDVRTQRRATLTANDFHSALQRVAGQGLPGVTITLLAQSEAAATPDLLIVTLAADRYRPQLRSSAPSTGLRFSAQSLLRDNQQLPLADQPILLGSFFVAGFAPVEPLGLLQINGQSRSALQPHGYTRILGISDAGLGIVHRGSFHRGLFPSAVQVGPGIIEQGQLDINPTERRLPKYLRSFVGACGDRAVLGVSFRPLHLYDLGQRLVAHLAEQGMTCDEVVNLSGDRETLLVLPEPDSAGSDAGPSLLVYGDTKALKSALVSFVPVP